MHLSAQFVYNSHQHPNTELQYGFTVDGCREDFFWSHVQQELQHYLCSWCYFRCHPCSSVLLHLWSPYCLISLAFLLVWLHVPGRIQWCWVCFTAPALTCHFLAASRLWPREAAAELFTPVAFHPLLCPRYFNFSFAVWGQSKAINTEHLKSDRDLKHRASGCHLVRGGGGGREGWMSWTFSSFIRHTLVDQWLKWMRVLLECHGTVMM